VFTLVYYRGDQRYVAPAESADEATVQFLLDNRENELLTVYPDDFELTIHSTMLKTSTENQ